MGKAREYLRPAEYRKEYIQVKIYEKNLSLAGNPDVKRYLLFTVEDFIAQKKHVQNAVEDINTECLSNIDEIFVINWGNRKCSRVYPEIKEEDYLKSD